MARLPPYHDNDRPGVSIERILTDPLVRAVMRADHVKPKVLATLLQSVASKRARSLITQHADVSTACTRRKVDSTL
jgi:hypothetical protein